MASSEYITLVNCAEKIENALKSDMREIAYYLHKHGFINQDICDEIIDPKSLLSPTDKAGKLLSKIKDKAKLNPQNYHRFLDYLRQNDRMHRDIINILDKEYKYLEASHKGQIEPAPYDDIESYSAYLKQKYKRFRMPLDGQWPPVQASDYVPLILSLSDLSKPDSEQVLTGKINKILKGDVDRVSNNLIEFGDIFEPDGANEPINSILVQGSPGIGKTAFSLTLCKKWAAAKLFGQFKIVILWALRDPAVKTFKSIDDLFIHDSKEVSSAVVKKVRRDGGKGVLFVLDGWDELPPEFSQSRNSFFLKLIEGNELPFSSVIVTSRNISSQKFLRHSIFNRTIDILGFSKACIDEYIHKCFSKSLKDRDHLLELLREQPNIQSFCYVPMNCSIVCYVFSRNQTLPSTLTKLYGFLAKNSLLRNVDLRGKDSKDNSDFDNLPDDVKSLYMSLCKLAYHGVLVNRYTYSRNDIAACCEASTGIVVDVDKLGVLQAVNVFHSEGVAASFHFLHTTLQEFMAATYIKSLNQEDQETVISSHFSILSFKMVWQFYCGLLANCKTSKNLFIEGLQTEVLNAADTNGRFHDNFSYCSSDEEFYDSETDSENESVLEETSASSECLPTPGLEMNQLADPEACHTEFISSDSFAPPSCLTNVGETSGSSDVLTSRISGELSPAQSLTMNEVPLQVENPLSSTKSDDIPSTITFSEHPNKPPITSLPFINAESGDDYNMTGSDVLVTTGGLGGVPTTLSDVTAVYVGKTNVYREAKLKILFTLRCIYETQSHRLCTSISDKLSSRLLFEKLPLSPEDINAIGYVIAKSGRKWQLRLVNCDIHINHLVMLRHNLMRGSSGKLTRLYLNDNNLDFTCVGELVEMLPVLKHLEKLSLGGNSLCDRSGIPRLIENLHALHSLDLSNNQITNLGLKNLACSLIHRNHLTHLDISHNSISPEGACIVADAITKISTLQYLNIGGNKIEDRGIQSLTEALAKNSFLLYFDVSDTGMTDEGIVLLASALQCNISLQSFIAHSNSAVTCDGVGMFLDLCAQTGFTKIDLSYCDIGWSKNMLTSLHNSLPTFEKLKTLDFSYNSLEDEGVAALIDAITQSSLISKLKLEGNNISKSLQCIGDFICQSTTIKTISLSESDIICTDADGFLDCLKINSSLQVVEIHEVENKRMLRTIFEQVNSHREEVEKNRIQFHYFPPQS